MASKSPAQQKIASLIEVGFLLVFVAVIAFGLAIIHNMTRLQASAQQIYVHPFAVSQAGLDAQATMLNLHNRTLEIILAGDPKKASQQDAEIQALDNTLRRDYSIIKAEFTDNTEKLLETEQLLSDWQNIRTQLIGLARFGHRNDALQLASNRSSQLYSRLESNLNQIAASAQRHVEASAEEARNSVSGIIHLVWWLLGGLLTFNVLSGVLVIRKVSWALEHNQQTSRQLHESEERLKLALSGADEGTWDLDPHTGQLSFDTQWGSILGYTAEKEKPHYLEEWAALIHADDREKTLHALQDHIAGKTPEYRAEYRIRSRSGELKWVIGHGRAVNRDANGKALRIVGVTRDISRRKQTEDKIWQLAHYDSLTGLPNRPLFYDRLSQSLATARRHEKKLALLFLDLDGFKQVNDKFGHDTGDGLLQEVAVRLRQHIRGEDTVARTGGDEFIFILNDISHAENAAVVADKVIRSLSEPFIINERTCLIGGSIGISVFPDNSVELETLVTQSDNAMYKAKENGKNNYQFFA